MDCSPPSSHAPSIAGTVLTSLSVSIVDIAGASPSTDSDPRVHELISKYAVSPMHSEDPYANSWAIDPRYLQPTVEDIHQALEDIESVLMRMDYALDYSNRRSWQLDVAHGSLHGLDDVTSQLFQYAGWLACDQNRALYFRCLDLAAFVSRQLFSQGYRLVEQYDYPRNE